MDILCLEQVAEELIGITAQEVTERPEKYEAALETLKELMLLGSICEGKIRSILCKDGKLYFIIKPMFCITAGIV